MTDKQANMLAILAKLEELDRLEETETNPETLQRISERKKALRSALDKLLNA